MSDSGNEEARAIEAARKALTPEVLAEVKRRGAKAKQALDAERAYEAKQEKKRAARERKRLRDIAKGEELKIDPTSTWMAPLTTYAVAANRSSRRFGLIGADGKPVQGRTVSHDEVLSGAGLKADIEIRGEDLYAKREQHAKDVARRKAGLPDLCDSCGSCLGMGRQSMLNRFTIGHPWSCRRCAAARRADPKFRKLLAESRVATCESCDKPLGGTESAAYLRAKRPRPWRCVMCAAKRGATGPLDGQTDRCLRCDRELRMTANAIKRRRRSGRHICQSCATTKGPPSRCLECNSEISYRSIRCRVCAPAARRLGAAEPMVNPDNPDRCDTCQSALSADPSACRKRHKKGHPWMCVRCSATSAQRIANSKGRAANSARVRKAWDTRRAS